MRTVLFLAIVKKGTASFFLEQARKAGATGGTILLADGTVSSPLMNLLGLHDSKREALLMLVDKEFEAEMHQVLAVECELPKKGKGVLFSFDTSSVYGSHRLGHDFIEGEGKMSPYQMVAAIVERGKADDVVQVARQAGGQGATILHGRGLGSERTSKIFNVQIEPEKEIVLMVVESDKVRNIAHQISTELDIDQPGAGIIFSMAVNNATGLFTS